MAQDPKALAPAWMVALFIGIGVLIAALGLGVIRSDPASMHAPRWVVVCTGGLFAVAGLLMAEQRAPQSLTARLLIAVFLSQFAAVFGWVGLGRGPRQFSSSVSFGGLTTHGAGNEMLGRVLFGGFGILVGVIALVTWLALGRAVLARTGVMRT
ncbi:MAG: hypothetical protein JOZ67_05565 [Gammaproteobacteria bacterium]|nr:hypothetical protein [Gammaproteobacteria bacterium]MBV9696801.1 hypothetical protein [Gammaproteobacteria bacterium]